MSALRAGVTALLLLGLIAVIATGASAAGADRDWGGRHTALLDDCDKSDPAWNAVGGCTKKGNVTFAEFNEEVADTPNSAAVVGHQAWRNDPAYLVVKKGATLKVKNRGGRPHTFTEVAEWGGGVVPPLNEGLAFSTECASLVELPPGARAKVENLTVGNHRFLCCFHPWMRTLVKVKPKRHGKHDD
jgi:plastocyanin